MFLAIGGHSRNIGKTSVAAGIIAATPEARWVAIKITQTGHGHCTTDGADCDCAGDPRHPVALDEQHVADSTDSGRYLAAGAARSFWLRTAAGGLGHALPQLRELTAGAPNTIVESNSILRFLQPDLYLVVLDFSIVDMKDSARLYMDRADAFVVVASGVSRPPWNLPPRWFQDKPVFEAHPPHYVGERLTGFVRSRLSLAETRA